MKMMLSLIPLIVLSILSMIFGNEFMIIISLQDIEEEKTMAEWLEEFDFGSSLAGGTIVGVSIVVLIAGLSIIIGLQILGSGLSDTTVKVLTIIISYTTLWLILSLLAFPLIMEIHTFGLIIYTVLSLIFVIGLVQMVSEGL